VRYYPVFFLDELRKTIENISEKSSCEVLIPDFPNLKSSTATLSIIYRVFENRYVHAGTFFKQTTLTKPNLKSSSFWIAANIVSMWEQNKRLSSAVTHKKNVFQSVAQTFTDYSVWLAFSLRLLQTGAAQTGVVTRQRVRQQMIHGSIPDKGKRFLFSPERPDRLWSPLSLLFSEYRGTKRAGRKAAHYLRIAPRLSMSGDVLLLSPPPQQPLRAPPRPP